jgi:transcriptional regulator with XRE-family HTH domain
MRCNDYSNSHYMKHIISSSEDLGFALRAVRKSSKVRLDDLSQTARVSKQTTANLEKGLPTVQLGKVLQLLAQVGLTLSVDLPESALPALKRVQREALERSLRSLGSDPDDRGSESSVNTGSATE